jgi:His-Xaa-Ser system protein HxsD
MAEASTADSGEAFRALQLSSAVYELEAVKRAAYRFADRIAVEITPFGEIINCRLIALSQASAKQLDQIASDFRIEVLDQDLRLKIAAETEPLRNLILSLAFSKTGLQE